MPENKGFSVDSQAELQAALKEVSATARKQLNEIKLSQLIATDAPVQPEFDANN